MPNGPGKSHRKGMSLFEIMDMFPNEEVAEEWFEEVRWGIERKPDHCPKCGCCGKIKRYENRKSSPFYCKACKSYFSVRTDTVMSHSAIPLRKWAIATYLWTTSLKSVSSMKLHRDLQISQKSAWFMAHRLREAWGEGNRCGKKGPVEVDETYIGGREANKHGNRKLKAGRGAVGKAIVAGARDRKSNTVSAKVVEDTRRDTLHGFVADNTESDTQVYTDDHSSYKGMDNPHGVVKHSVSEYVRDQAHTNGIESFWALLKRGYHGTFHHFSEKHLQRYVNEFACRHNLRPLDTYDMMEHSAAMMTGKRLTYRELTIGRE